MVLPLLLKNVAASVDQNSCFANCILQLLRRIPNIKDTIIALPPETNIHLELKKIFLNIGSYRKISVSKIRSEVATRFSTGSQQDCKEFLDSLLTSLSLNFEDLFKYKIKNSFVFVETNYSPACRYCNQVESPVQETEGTLFLSLYEKQNLVLQHLIDQYFDFDEGSKKCSKCLNFPQQKYRVYKEFSEPGPFLLIQLKRFDNHLQKLDHLVQGSFTVRVKNTYYELIAIVDHLGNYNNGHYRTILESKKKWYLCEDDKIPQEVPKNLVFSKANYIYLFQQKELSEVNQPNLGASVPRDKPMGKDSVKNQPAGTSGLSPLKSLFYKDKESLFECINISPDESQDSAIFLPASAISETSKFTTVSPEVHDEASDLSKLPQEISGRFSGKHINYEDNQSSEQGQNMEFFPKTKQSMPYPETKKCFVNLGKKIDEINHSSQMIDKKSKNNKLQMSMENQQAISKKDGSTICDSTDKEKIGLPNCKGCGKHFKRIKQHLNYNISCKGSYLLSELESGKEKQEKERKRKARQREAKRQADEQKFRAERLAEKQKERDRKREEDEQKFRAEM